MADATRTEQVTTNIPEWARPFASQLFGRVFGDPNAPGGGLLGQPYRQYAGQMVAGFNPLQQAAFSDLAGMDIAPQTREASGLASLAGRQAGRVGRRYERMATDPRSIQAYMSPYMQGVVEQQKQQALQDYARQIPGLQTAGIRAGARGGTREALLQSEAQRNLNQQLQGIQATGLQNAFQQAQQAQQFGAGLGLQGLQQQLAAAGALGGLGQQQYQQGLGISQAQLGAGQQIQGVEQQQLAAQYQDFLNRMQFPYRQTEFASGILRGFQPTGQTTTLYQPSGSTLAGTIGTGAGLGGLFSALGG
jgi:hypothetical protein